MSNADSIATICDAKQSFAVVQFWWQRHVCFYNKVSILLKFLTTCICELHLQHNTNSTLRAILSIALSKRNRRRRSYDWCQNDVRSWYRQIRRCIASRSCIRQSESSQNLVGSIVFLLLQSLYSQFQISIHTRVKINRCVWSLVMSADLHKSGIRFTQSIFVSGGIEGSLGARETTSPGAFLLFMIKEFSRSFCSCACHCVSVDDFASGHQDESSIGLMFYFRKVGFG